MISCQEFKAQGSLGGQSWPSSARKDNATSIWVGLQSSPDPSPTGSVTFQGLLGHEGRLSPLHGPEEGGAAFHFRARGAAGQGPEKVLGGIQEGSTAPPPGSSPRDAFLKSGGFKASGNMGQSSKGSFAKSAKGSMGSFDGKNFGASFKGGLEEDGTFSGPEGGLKIAVTGRVKNESFDKMSSEFTFALLLLLVLGCRGFLAIILTMVSLSSLMT